MIDTDKYEGHDLARGRVGSDYNIYDRKGNIIFDADDVGSNMATLNLLADAPLLLAEVKRLRGQLGQAREYLWWCYDKERFGWEVDEEHWELIGRFLGASSDHNNNERSEEE